MNKYNSFKLEVKRTAGEYQYDLVQVDVSVGNDDNIVKSIATAKKDCIDGLELRLTSPQQELPLEEKKAPEPAPAKKAPATKKKATKKKVTKKLKAIPYDRSNDVHKKHIGEYLDKEFPTWRKDTKVKSAAVQASKTMASKEDIAFMDSKGTIQEPFFVEFSKIVNVHLRA